MEGLLSPFAFIQEAFRCCQRSDIPSLPHGALPLSEWPEQLLLRNRLLPLRSLLLPQSRLLLPQDRVLPSSQSLPWTTRRRLSTMDRLVCFLSIFLFVVHPILSRFAVPPVPEKEPRINPDIKRLQPTPSYEKHRVVSVSFIQFTVGFHLPD